MELDKSKLVNVKQRNLDELGNIYLYDGTYIRIIKKAKSNYLKKLFASGLIDRLVSEGLMSPVKMSELTCDGLEVVESITTEPYQEPRWWTFEMHKAAALLVLKVNRICMEYGYELMDCHQKNIMFRGTVPVYVDLGSIARVSPDYTWRGRDEFLKFRLFKLALWNGGFRSVAVCINSFLILDYEEIERLYEMLPSNRMDLVRKVPHGNEENLKDMRELEEIVSNLSESDVRFWSDYQDIFWGNKPQQRFINELEWIKAHPDIRSMTDLGCNQGFFSYLAVTETQVERVTAIDYDKEALDKLFTRLGQDERVADKILPLGFNFVLEDTSIIGKLRNDLLVANAFLHHMIIREKMTMDNILDKFCAMTEKYLIVEFMPRGMADAGRLPEFYSQDWFTEQIAKRFDIEKVEEGSFGRVQIYATKKEENLWTR